MEQTKETKEFYAFISYKREDESWARRLQCKHKCSRRTSPCQIGP